MIKVDRLSFLAFTFAVLSLQSKALAVTGGALTSDRRFEAVLSYQIQARENGNLCTATVIGPRHLLTAAHCVDDIDPKTFMRFLLADFPKNVQLELDKKNGVRFGDTRLKVYLFDDWKGSVARGMDVAIIELHSNLNVKPMRISTTPVQAGERLLFAGYGCDQETKELRTNLKIGMATRSSLRANTFATRSSPTKICKGDSGGPFMRVAADGELEIVGVTSFYFRLGHALLNSRDHIARIDAETEARVDLWIKMILDGRSQALEYNGIDNIPAYRLGSPAPQRPVNPAHDARWTSQ